MSLPEAISRLSTAADPTYLDLSIVQQFKNYDKLGNKILIHDFKYHYFGSSKARLTKERCEEFFGNVANFMTRPIRVVAPPISGEWPPNDEPFGGFHRAAANSPHRISEEITEAEEDGGLQLNSADTEEEGTLEGLFGELNHNTPEGGPTRHMLIPHFTSAFRAKRTYEAERG